MSIFVSIASYRDSQLIHTIMDLFENAHNPNDIYVGVFDQSESPLDFSKMPNVRYLFVDYRDTRGVGYALSMADSLYDGEDYCLQIDSHMRFADAWDVKIIDMLNQAKKIAGTEKVILSSAPPHYIPMSDHDVMEMPSEYNWLKVVRNPYGWWTYSWQYIDKPEAPVPSQSIIGCCVFSNGSIISDVPHNPDIAYLGEELCFSLEAYCKGWEIYAMNEYLFWHYYIRNDSPKVWMDFPHWKDREVESSNAIKDVLTGKNISNLDRYKKYQDMIGIDFKMEYS